MKYTLIIILGLCSFLNAQELNVSGSKEDESSRAIPNLNMPERHVRKQSETGFYMPSYINYFYNNSSENLTEKRDTFNYNKYGDLLNVEKQDWNGLSWESNARKIYQYDENRNRILFQDELDQGDWYINRTTYEYDGKNRLIKTVESAGYVDSVKDTYCDEQTYNDERHTYDKITKQWNGSKWIVSSKMVTKYDQNNRDTAQLYYEWNLLDWKLTEEVKNLFDSEGKLSTQLIYLYAKADGSLSSTWKSAYFYNYKGAIQTILKTFRQDGDWGYNEKEEFEYDENGNRTMHAKLVWNNSTWINQSKYSYSYDEAGNLLSEIYYTGGDEWVPYNKKEYECDSLGNTVHGVYYSWANNNWEMKNGLLYFGDKIILGTYGNAKYIYIDNSIEVKDNGAQPDNFSLA
ncbi:MAG TPA: hypothetical protein VHP30_09760, partial [Ignavibacteriales bacterium]|nr:hypothetical protein [Ignavibacteriales bacterium]